MVASDSQCGPFAMFLFSRFRLHMLGSILSNRKERERAQGASGSVSVAFLPSELMTDAVMDRIPLSQLPSAIRSCGPEDDQLHV